MSRRVRFGWIALASSVALAGIATSCEGLSEGERCEDIPSSGCPEDRGGTCDDPTCAAIYACNDGAWSLAKSCDRSMGSGGGRSGGSRATGAITTGTGPSACSTQGPDAGCTVVNLDTTDTATDCTPDLDLTQGDCAWQIAQGSCVQCVCLTGCLTFYKCTPPGWVAIASCDANGSFIASSP